MAQGLTSFTGELGLVARWPQRIAPGKVSDAMISLVDMVATFAALTKQRLPEEGAADSLDMLPALLDGKAGREWLYSSRSIREGPWKLIPGQKMLFNLIADPGEKDNAYSKHPDIVAKLQMRWDGLRSGSTSRPLPDSRIRQAVLDKLDPAAGKNPAAKARAAKGSGRK